MAVRTYRISTGAWSDPLRGADGWGCLAPARPPLAPPLPPWEPPWFSPTALHSLLHHWSYEQLIFGCVYPGTMGTRDTKVHG
jgi:hypothetical protein